MPAENPQKIMEKERAIMFEIPKKNRTNIVNVRLTEDELDYLQYRQKLIGAKSLSAYIRYAAISKQMTVIDKDSLKKILVDIAGIRNSLNQIAKRLNSTNQFYDDDKNTIADATKEIEELWQSLNTMLSKQP